jgi:hypothetical protein
MCQQPKPSLDLLSQDALGGVEDEHVVRWTGTWHEKEDVDVLSWT